MVARGGSFTLALETRATGVRPRVTDGGGEGTKAKEVQTGILRRSSHRFGGQHQSRRETFRKGRWRQVNEIPIYGVEVRRGHPTVNLTPIRRSAQEPVWDL